MWRRLSVLFCLLLCLCSSQKEPAGQNLILLLVDGYGANLFNQTDSRTKSGTRTLLENGMEATSLKPVYPTQSYPNWFSLATGLYVESHNFTSDFMFEPNSSMLFQRDMGMNDSNPFWWTGYPAPLWYAVGKAGIDVHCYWFPACHKAHVDLIVQVPQNRRHSFNNANKIDLLPHLPTIIKHIKKYQPYRQQLVLLRYNGLDEALRAGGQSSRQTRQALSTVDTYIRRIQEEMDTMDLHQSTNLIVLSDHGLMAVEEEDQFYVEECLADFSMVRQVANSLAFTMIWPIDGEEDTVFFELKVCDQWAFVGDYENEEAAPLVSVYRRHELPEHFHWRDSRLVAPIVLIARPGIVLLTRNLPSTDVSEKLAKEWKMLDGWDNEHEEMQGIFMARGPAFKSHYKGEEQVEVVDIYQLVLNILGVEPTHFSNGSWNRVADVLSEGWEDRRYEPQSFALSTPKAGHRITRFSKLPVTIQSLHQIHFTKLNKIFKNTQKQQKDKEKTTMGNTETSLAGFSSTVVELTSKNSNTGEELDWDKLLPINTGNDLFTALQPSDIRGLRDEQPNALSILCYKAVHVLARATQTNPTQKEHRKILNCTRLLTRLIPFLFEESEWRQFFWTNLPDNGTDGLNDSQKQLPLSKLLLTALSDLLFCPNFTIGLLEKNIHLENISKLDTCEHIWQSGVGFANKTPASAVYDVNRTELLRLLLVCFSEVIYTPTPEESKMRWITHFTSTENRHVLPLFTSLLNSVCAYDPVGLGMPYNYLLFVDSREPLVEVALQLLVVCLDRDSQPNSDKIGYVENYFVNYLSRIHREDDFEFMLKGFTRLLNNQLQTSYLPNSTKKVGLHQELLVLVWKCCEYNQKFLYYVLKSSDVLDILVPILFHLNESRTDPTRIGLIHMGVFLILLLSGERNFGVRLNKPFTSRGLIDVPIFTGTHADLLIIIFHKLITSGNHKLQSLFDCLLTIIVNVSPYLKSLSMVTANKLVHLVEAFSTPWFIFSSPTNHHLIFFLLEMFNNIIQYQFDGNSNLVYTIIRKRQVFYQLANLSSDSVSIAQSLKRGKKIGDSKPNEETEHPMEHAEEGEESGDRAKHQQIEVKASSLAQTPAIGAMTTMEESAENKRMAEQNQAQKVQGIKEQHHQQQQQQEKEEQVNVVCETEEEWAPTSEWVESWKKKLPLQTIMRVLQILVPQVEKICIDKGLTDESEILKFLQHGTLVGLLPVPHPILIRKYIANSATNNWFRTYLWGVVYCRNIEPPIWFDSNVTLFEIQRV